MFSSYDQNFYPKSHQSGKLGNLKLTPVDQQNLGLAPNDQPINIHAPEIIHQASQIDEFKTPARKDQFGLKRCQVSLT